MKKTTTTLYVILAMIFGMGNAFAQNGECLTPVDYTAVIGADGTATINPENVVNIGDDCSFASLTVSPNEFSCEELGIQTVSITGTTPLQPTGNYTSVPAPGIYGFGPGVDMASGDIDGDGDIDIAADRGWQRNQSNYFAPIAKSGSNLAGVQLGDLDGDGDLDLVSTTSIYHWNGSGYVYMQNISTEFNINMPIFGSASLADFDNDGDLDYYVQTYYWGENGKERLFINDGSGTFTLGNSFVISSYQMTSAAGDFDEDGTMDVVIAGYYDVYVGFNDGAFVNGDPVNFNFTSVFSNGNDYIRDVKAKDFNGDGHLDLAFVGYPSINSVRGLVMMFGNGDGTFQNAQLIDAYGFSWDMDVNDYEGDGDLDIVSLVNGENARLYLNDGSGNFTTTELGFKGIYNNTTRIIMDDFNDDGICDFAKSGEVLITEWLPGEEITVTSNVTVTDPNSVCNAAPVAIAQDVTASTSANCDASVAITDIDNGSYDPDGDAVTYSVFPEGPYALGNTTVTLTVSDGELSSTASAIVTVVDDVAPVISTPSSPITLWPPNHKYKTINVSECFTGVSDNCGVVSSSDIVITKVTSDEPENAKGGGDGNTVNDMVIASDCKSVELRKERKGNGNGRVYTIHMEVTDDNGNTGSATYQVHVPKNNNGTAVDDGAVYEVTGNCGGNKSVLANFDGAKNEVTMKAYPNPTNGTATIEISFEQTTYAKVDVYNSYGQNVVTLKDGIIEAGVVTKLQLDGSSLPKGIYYIRLQAENNIFSTQKLIITK